MSLQQGWQSLEDLTKSVRIHLDIALFKLEIRMIFVDIQFQFSSTHKLEI